MATLGELKARIALEMDRQDLTDELSGTLDKHVREAIEFFTDERFYFSAIVIRANCTAQSVTMDIPTEIKRIDKITLPDVYVELRELTLPELEKLQDGVFAQPRYYAYYNDQIRFWPVPDKVYVLEFTGVLSNVAPATDADSNVWTTTCESLISNRTKMTLARDVFRDPEGVQLYGSAAAEALQRLRSDTAKRLVTPLRMPNDGGTPGNRFNIYYD
jgi:hypothetical protein